MPTLSLNHDIAITDSEQAVKFIEALEKAEAMNKMERLTFEGNFCDIAKCEDTPGGSFCEYGYCDQRRVWERLKEYEDIGTVEKFAELAQAESEGRLVELPIAIGGKVYTIDDKYDHCRRCDFAKKHDLYDYCDCIEYCKQHDVTDDICPETEYEIKEHKVEGYEIRDKNKLKASDAGEWGYEGLEKFNSYDGFDVYFSHEAAEAALAAKEGERE